MHVPGLKLLVRVSGEQRAGRRRRVNSDAVDKRTFTWGCGMADTERVFAVVRRERERERERDRERERVSLEG